MKNLQKLSIGQMAKLNHISEQTLRLYDKMDLLKPLFVNKETGYRYYSIGQSATLDMIQHYKEIGIPLKEIHERLNEINLNTMPSILQDRYDYIERELEELRASQAAILRSIDNFNRYMSLPQIGKIFYEYIPERQICVYNTGADLFSYSYYEYEYHLRMFKDYLIEHNFPLTYFSNVGTLMRYEHIKSGTPDFFSDEIFVFTDSETKCSLETETVPAGTYFSMCCSEFDAERSYAIQLFDRLRMRNYKVLGDYLCEVVVEYPNTENGQREIFYKMQVRIK
ncbi:MAG: helix-turn-helix domain-containing protein [Clostridiales bacterium]|nr:helix-turn-helix domain-containing protein [Clostridiales bacterium]